MTSEWLSVIPEVIHYGHQSDTEGNQGDKTNTLSKVK